MILRHCLAVVVATVLFVFTSPVHASHSAECIVKVELSCDGECGDVYEGTVVESEKLDGYGAGCPKPGNQVRFRPRSAKASSDGDIRSFRYLVQGDAMGESKTWTQLNFFGCSTTSGNPSAWALIFVALAAFWRRR